MFLNKDKTDAIRGIAIIMIIVHHLYNNYNIIYLFPFAYMGYVGVAIFFLLSGYALMEQYKSNNKYLKGFLIKKYLRLFVAYIVTLIFFLVMNFIFTRNIDINKLFFNIFTLSIDNMAMWYLKVQALMYLFFYICFKFVNNIRRKIILVFLLCVIYVVVLFILRIELRWYFTVLWFPLGILLSYNKQIVSSFIQKHKIFVLPFSLLFVGIIAIIFMWGTLGIDRIMDILLMISGIVSLIFLSEIINIRIVPLVFIGKISLELYLIHSIIFDLFKITSKNVLFLLVFILVLSFIDSRCINFLSHKILKLLNRSKIIKEI